MKQKENGTSNMEEDSLLALLADRIWYLKKLYQKLTHWSKVLLNMTEGENDRGVGFASIHWIARLSCLEMHTFIATTFATGPSFEELIIGVHVKVHESFIQ